MSWADWCLVALVAGWFCYLLLRPRKKGCCTRCNGCSQCSHCGGCENEK